MWCYQKPGFIALLLAELQRQQQCSRFCDTMLRTEGIFKHLNLTFFVRAHDGRLAWKPLVPELASSYFHTEKCLPDTTCKFMRSGFAGINKKSRVL